MIKVWNSFKTAFAMYSKIPVPRADFEPENMRYMLCFFPLVGLMTGMLEVLWSKAADLLAIGDIFRTAVFVLIPLLVSGGIHMDGLLDTADALSSYRTREEKLKILKDSNAGAFAVIVGGCYLIAYFGVWSELNSRQVLLLAGAFVLERALSGLSVASFPCATRTGTVAMFADAADKRTVRAVLIIEALLAAGWMCIISPAQGAAGTAGALLSFAWYYNMSKRQFGGITGDIAGFFLQVCELVIALCVCLAGKFI